MLNFLMQGINFRFIATHCNKLGNLRSDYEYEIDVRLRLFKISLHAQDNHLSHKFCTWSLFIFRSATGRTDSSGIWLALN